MVSWRMGLYCPLLINATFTISYGIVATNMLLMHEHGMLVKDIESQVIMLLKNLYEFIW